MEAQKEIRRMTLLGYQQRVYAEKEELDQKIEKLAGFLVSTDIGDVAPLQRSLLDCQLHLMRSYAMVLAMRIEGFG